MLRIKSIHPKYIPWRLLNSSDCLQLSIQSLKCACSKCRKKVAGRMLRQKANYEHKTTISLSSKCKRENSKANGFQRGCWSTLTSGGRFLLSRTKFWEREAGTFEHFPEKWSSVQCTNKDYVKVEYGRKYVQQEIKLSNSQMLWWLSVRSSREKRKVKLSRTSVTTAH